jgi:hypothetical protein
VAVFARAFDRGEILEKYSAASSPADGGSAGGEPGSSVVSSHTISQHVSQYAQARVARLAPQRMHRSAISSPCGTV